MFMSKNSVVVKVLKTGSGLWAVFWGADGKAIKLAYRRWFKDEITAQRWAEKFARKLGLHD